jgi:hypothetical protein
MEGGGQVSCRVIVARIPSSRYAWREKFRFAYTFARYLVPLVFLRYLAGRARNNYNKLGLASLRLGPAACSRSLRARLGTECLPLVPVDGQVISNPFAGFNRCVSHVANGVFTHDYQTYGSHLWRLRQCRKRLAASLDQLAWCQKYICGFEARSTSTKSQRVYISKARLCEHCYQ